MEEKIIDGVDVSKCCCYENGKCLWTKRYYDNNIVADCEKVKDCYYKQLKRLEQEQSHNKLYDDLLEVVKPYLSDFTGYDEKEQCFNIVLAVKELLGQLKEEKVALQKSQFCVAYEKDCYKSCQQQNCAIKNYYKYTKELEQGNLFLQKKLRKYKHALEETKKIASKVMTEDWTVGYDDILQIITEVIGE